ncbi:MAG: methyltransferase domain-containing protein [Parcubacteria group bacterium]
MERVIYERLQALEQDHWWFAGRRAILARLIGDLGLPKDARILEAGCGAGGNLKLLGRFGAVQAMEPDEPSRKYVAEHWGVQVDPGFLPDRLPYAPESFDAVCCFDVIEHVDQDREAVAALAGLLKSGGHLVATVPAYQWMWSHHDELHHHKRRYTLGQMKRLFAEAGLKIERASYFNALLFPLAAAVRVTKNLLGIRTEDDAMPSAGVNRILQGLFASEAGWLRRGSLPFGLSIVIIGKKA